MYSSTSRSQFSNDERLDQLQLEVNKLQHLNLKLDSENQELAEKYGIRGFPTVLLMNGDGKVIGTTGYRRGGAESYVAHLKTLVK